MTRARAALLLLVLALAVAGSSAGAATFETYADDGEDYCALDLAGPDGMRISGERGKGATGEVWVEFKAKRDASFSADYELRLEITTGSDVMDAFIGGTEEPGNVPSFLLPLSTVGTLASGATFTYRLEDRMPVKARALTRDELQQFLDCMIEE